VYVRRHIRRGYNGRFLGFRINCEYVPLLPAWAVQWMWEDPRRIPYLLAWKHRREGTWSDAVRLTRLRPKTHISEADAVEIKRGDGSIVPVYLAWRRQPKGGRILLLKCWRCQKPCRALYGWKIGDDGHYYKAVQGDWQCRRCAELRYSSEGGALLIRGGIMSRILRQPFPAFSSPRPESWFPHVFTSLDDAIDFISGG
jgi:hypothetical protein